MDDEELPQKVRKELDMFAADTSAIAERIAEIDMRASLLA
jgi:hypothetical protein